MSDKTDQQGFQHFPEDRDAPVISNNSFFNDFYQKNKKVLDVVIFAFMLVLTLFTVSFSFYIIATKYL